MSISTTAPEIKEARARYEWTQENVANDLNFSRQMIQMVEAGKRRLNEQDAAKLARKLDDGQFAMAMARRITGGMSAPYLNGIDNHRMACIMKLVEELQEAIDIITQNMRTLIRAQSADDLSTGERVQIEVMMIETIEAITAAENTLARLSKTYDISLADLWDRHEKELTEKGYLRKEKDRISAAI
jgi:DNA-binding XRE family transcriptional regulator